MPKLHSKSNPITYAFWLNLLFSIIELVGGLYTNSTAIIADAFHDFMDAMAIGGAAILERYAHKSADDIYTFGYKRFSILSAIILSVILISGSVLMIFSAIETFQQTKTVNSVGMFVLAIVGIVINGIAFLKFKHTDSEHTNHSHHIGHKHSNNNRAIMLHLLEDVLGWIAVLVGAIVIYFTKWYWIDSILTLSIAIFILYNAIRNIIISFAILMLKTPVDVHLIQLKEALMLLEEVDEIIKINVWSLDGNENMALVHIKTHNDLIDVNISKLKREIVAVFQAHHVQSVNIELNV
jgi:cobalt-zinc-cadmium efflux system protein